MVTDKRDTEKKDTATVRIRHSGTELKYIGGRIRSARQLAGFSSMPAFSHALGRVTNLEASVRVIQKWEAGESTPTALELRDICLTTEPPGGIDFFYPPMTHAHSEAWERAKVKRF